jgi:ABC-type Fe3+ transport system permease subunit
MKERRVVVGSRDGDWRYVWIVEYCTVVVVVVVTVAVAVVVVAVVVAVGITTDEDRVRL